MMQDACDAPHSRKNEKEGSASAVRLEVAWFRHEGEGHMSRRCIDLRNAPSIEPSQYLQVQQVPDLRSIGSQLI